jgi:hypothetical protein
MKPDRFILLLLAISLLLAAFTLTDYGESWDDHSLRKYADYSLRTYQTWREQGLMPITEKDLGNYGPAYMMTVLIASRALSFLPINEADIRHIFYFLTHLAGVWAFYALAQRWLTQTAARYATLLYVTQPLFWGHAFMNPKDTPFLAFFMLSLLFGLRMVDSLDSTQRPELDSPLWQRGLTTGGAILLLGLFAATPTIHAAIEALVRSAAGGQTNIITYLATDLNKVPPEIYIQKYFTYFLWLRAVFFILFSLITIYHLSRPMQHATLVTSHAPRLLSHSSFLILTSSFMLGFSTSIRILAPFAGLLVALYALRKLGKRAITPLIIYSLLSILFCYITWPYLWSDPIGHFIEAFQTMTKYPWFGKVLFNGSYYNATELPYSYLPLLLLIQFTEPIWILFIIGIIKLLRSLKEATNHEPLTIVILWFILPLSGFILTRAKLYDNFRQIFFILPPVFLLAGLGMESLLARLTKPALRFSFALLLILPGLIAGVRLHPYQYVYYNALVQNPNERFELDYWAISYREAMEYVNTVAPANSNIMVVGPGQTADLYARADLTVLSDDALTTEAFDYAIITTRNGFDKTMYPDAKAVYAVERDGMILTVVKKME